MAVDEFSFVKYISFALHKALVSNPWASSTIVVLIPGTGADVLLYAAQYLYCHFNIATTLTISAVRPRAPALPCMYVL